MDGKLAFWNWAFAILLAVAALGVSGVREIRAGRVQRHRRRMLAAGALVGLFLATYAVKLVAMGREDRSLWSAASLWTLYLHEVCVAVMLLGAALALMRARRFGRLQDGAAPAPDARVEDRRLHRRAGKVAVVASILALLTAAGVLAGMYVRAGT